MSAETSHLTEETPSDPNLCLLLLGKTGHGKSATGNTILGSKPFISSASCESVTTYARHGVAFVDDYVIKVVDTPGLGDTRMGTEESEKLAMRGFNNGIALCPEGFHALILVFKFGQRMTDEERDAIKKLKEMLGENILREWTILLITHGDHFDEEEEGMPFIQWCKSQKGFMKELLYECDYRFVLFSNKTKDKTELSRQRKELIGYVNGLKTNGKRYSNELFDEANEGWKKLTKERKYANVIGEFDAGLEQISKDLDCSLTDGAGIGQGFLDNINNKLRALHDKIKDVEEPFKAKMEGDIKCVGERVKRCRTQENYEKRLAESLAVKQEIQRINQVHQAQMELIQAQLARVQDELSKRPPPETKITVVQKKKCVIQ